MKTAIVQRRDLDVLDFAAIIRPLELETEIGELDVSVTHGQLVLGRPLPDLAVGSADATIGIGSSAVGLLQEALVFTLQVVLEHDPHEPGVALGLTRERSFKRAIDLGVMLELTRSQDIRVERLHMFGARIAVRLQQRASLVRERDDGRALAAIERCNGTNQAVRPQPFNIPVPDISGAASVIANVVHGHDAKGADRGEGPDL